MVCVINIFNLLVMVFDLNVYAHARTSIYLKKIDHAINIYNFIEILLIRSAKIYTKYIVVNIIYIHKNKDEIRLI